MSYYLSRSWILRLLCLCYAIFFLKLFMQGHALIGRKGIVSSKYLLKDTQNVMRKMKLKAKAIDFLMTPSIFRLISVLNLDKAITACSLTGLGLSALVIVSGAANFFIMFALYFLYLSFLNIENTFFHMQTYDLLSELGFLALFLVPLFEFRQLSRSKPSIIVIYAIRYLLFRVVFEAGLSKLNGSEDCWFKMNCTQTIFETEGMPTHLGYYIHFMPTSVHLLLGALVWISVIITPPFFLLPIRKFRNIAAIFQIVSQIGLFLSFHDEFNPILLCACAMACLDDATLGCNEVEKQEITKLEKENKKSIIRMLINAVLFLGIVYLSAEVVKNHIPTKAKPNPIKFKNLVPRGWRNFNIYGGVQRVPTNRVQVTMYASQDENVTNIEDMQIYEHYCIPSIQMPGFEKSQPPCAPTAYLNHIDLNFIYFGRFGVQAMRNFIILLLDRIYENDQKTLSLFSRNPYQGSKEPEVIAFMQALTKFAPPGSFEAKNGHWYRVEKSGVYSKHTPKEYVKQVMDEIKEPGSVQKAKEKQKDHMRNVQMDESILNQAKKRQ